MARIPLTENTLTSQLIISRIFFFSFMLTGVGMGEVEAESMESLSDPHVLVGKSSLS